MLEKMKYPKIKQSISLLIVYILISFVIQFIFEIGISIVDINSDNPIYGAVVEITSIMVLLLWLNKKNKTVLLKGMFSSKHDLLKYMIPLTFVTIGLALIDVRIDNLMVTIIPVTPFLLEIFNNAFTGKISLGGFFLRAVIVAPFIEEILFRGIILNGFLKNYSIKKAIIISALLFALIHLNPWQFFGPMIWGGISGWWFYKTKSLIPCIWGHAVHNFIAFLYTIICPDYSFGQIIDQPLWIDGIGVSLLLIGVFISIKVFKNDSRSLLI